MLFLFFDNVDIDLISYALRYLAAKICGLLYRLIAGLFELFINISKVSILSSNDIQEIYKRVTLIITIVMVFYVTFETVKYVIQPETMTDKEKGASKIITKMIISVVLLAFVPNIFSFAFQVQNTIINQQVIPKVILGASNAASSNPKDMGRNFAATTFSMFYGYTYPNDPSNATNEVILNSCTEKDDYWTVMWPGDKNDGELNTVGRNLCTLKHTGKFYDIAYGIGEGSGVEDPSDDDNEIPLIDFDGLLAIIVGAFMIYVLALYCIDLGTRAAQLAFLQLIAPIPIIGYLSPKKDNMFSKWVQQCITTYLDLFLRTVLIYFVLFLCDTLNTARENGSLFNGLPADSDNTLIYIAIILGLLLFAQKAPKLLQELFPKMGAASGNFGLKPGDRNLKTAGRIVGAAAGSALGAAAGLATGIAQGAKRRKAVAAAGGSLREQRRAAIRGGLSGAIRGTTGGFARGAYNGSKKGNVIKNSLKGAQNQIGKNKQYGNRQEKGYSFKDQMEDRIRNAAGWKSRTEELESQKAPIERQNQMYDKIKKANDDIRARAEKKVHEGKGQYAGQLAAAEKKVRDFKEDASVKAKYTVSKYTTQVDADKAYQQAQIAEMSKVNKANFIDENNQLDKAAYDEALAAAAAQVNKDDYKVGYATEAAAKAAYEADVQTAQAELKSIKDQAIADYIDNENDGQINTIRSNISKEMITYQEEADFHLQKVEMVA